MATHTFDPKKAMAILIGVSKYTGDFHAITPATSNVTQLARLLSDPAIAGIPEDRIVPILDETDHEIKEKLIDHTQRAKEEKLKTLLLYYAGHGYRRTDGEYFLAATNSKKRLINLDGNTALSYKTVKNILQQSGMPQSIVILDACYSGLATQDGSHQLPDLELKGNFTLASSDSDEVSYFDTDQSHTLFTGELLQLLEHGLPSARDWVSLKDLYEALHKAVKKKNPRMNPQQQSGKELLPDSYLFFRNKRFDPQREKAREVEGEILEGESFIEEGKVERARRYFMGLQRDVEQEITHPELREPLLARIEEKLEFCRFYLRHQALLERVFRMQTSGENTKIQAIADELRAELGAQAEAVKNLETELKEKNSAIARLEKEGKAAAQEAAQLRAEKAALTQQLEKKQAELGQLEKASAKAQKEAEASIAALKKDLVEKDRTLVGLQAKIEELKASRPSAQPPAAGMVRVKGGSFDMGDVMGDNHEKDETVHRVTVADFYLGQYAVTVGEFRQFVEDASYQTLAETDGGSNFWEGSEWKKKAGVNWRHNEKGQLRPPEESDHPVLHVSWYDAVEYCNWRSRKEGLQEAYDINRSPKVVNENLKDDPLKWAVTCNWKANGYRLPTEAEWEYAARQGGRGGRFGNGKDIADPKEINFGAVEEHKQPYSVVGEYRSRTVPVGSLKCPNGLGLHDMSGNVWEWCWDWYAEYPTKAEENPRGPEQGSYRVLRGGGWSYTPQYCRAAYRSTWRPSDRYGNLGFRLARS